MEEQFTIYRPETTTGRLEGTYYQDSGNNWRPSLSYKYKIQDIRNQFTPAESYRHALATSGKHIRMIQRLEIRWHHNYPAFVRASIKIQSLYRGNVARERFRTIEAQLMLDLRRRQIRVTSAALFTKGLYQEAIEEINRNMPVSVELLGIKMKCLYKTKQYADCIQTAEEIIEMDGLSEDAYYIQACCQLCQGDDDAAYKTMKLGAIQLEMPARNTLKLCAYIATRISPPRFMEAVDSLSSILKKNPQDFEALVERACCYFCVQDWSAGIKDLNFVLVFVPVHAKALLFRARAHACTRQWELAQADYHSVLMHHPGNVLALQGLKDIQDTVIVLPMLGDGLLENESS